MERLCTESVCNFHNYLPQPPPLQGLFLTGLYVLELSPISGLYPRNKLLNGNANF